MFAGAILTVGSVWEPLANALKWHPAERVLFVVSAQSEPLVVTNILPALPYTPQYDLVRVALPEDLAACYRDCCCAIREWLGKWRLRPQEVYFDNTGGTKPMSAALAMAACESSIFRYHYVSGRRDKGELGIVVSGTEYSISGSVLALKHREIATRFYEQGYVEQAAQLLDEAAAMAADQQHTLRAYAALCRILGKLDRLDFRTDLAHELGRWQSALLVAWESADNREAAAWLPRFREHLAALHREVGANAEHPACLRELLACARRRATQGLHDEAIARLYRAVELYGQDRLQRAFGAHLGVVNLNTLNPALAEQLRSRFSHCLTPDGRLKLALMNVYQALEFSPAENDRALRSTVYEHLKDILQKRNDSWLAHGTRSASREDFEQTWRAVLQALEISEEQIPAWPKISFAL